MPYVQVQDARTVVTMGIKYYICVKKRWLRVRLQSDGATLEGTDTRPVFFVRSDDKLRYVSSAKVSRELRAHAAGLPSRARNGPLLDCVRRQRRRHRCRWRRRAAELNQYLILASQTVSVGVNTNGTETRPQQQIEKITNLGNDSEANFQRETKITAPQKSVTDKQQKHNIVKPSDKIRQQVEEIINIDKDRLANFQRETKLTVPQKSVTDLQKKRNFPKPPDNIPFLKVPDRIENVPLQRRSTTAIDTDHTTNLGPNLQTKDIIISYDDFTLIRNWCINDNKAEAHVGKVQKSKFDNDELYRKNLLCRLQPLVQLSNSKKLDTRIHKASKDEFAAVLGLVPADSASVRTGNPPRPSRTSALPSVTQGSGSQARSPYRMKRPFREFSALEDSAIVKWVTEHGAEHRVNGNTFWQELQPRYKALTGTERTWHSLRNRYLRYILPSLPKLGLSPNHARRLRAAAAVGEMKRKQNRRNSLVEKHIPVAVPSAHAAVKKRRIEAVSSSSESDAFTDESKRRRTRDNKENVYTNKLRGQNDKSKADHPSSPSYSALTRAFAAKHRHSRSTAEDASPADAPAPVPATAQRPVRRLYNP